MPLTNPTGTQRHRLVAEAPPSEPASIVPRTLAAAAGWPALELLAAREGMHCFLPPGSTSRGRFSGRCSGHFGSCAAAWVLQCAAGKGLH